VREREREREKKIIWDYSLVDLYFSVSSGIHMVVTQLPGYYLLQKLLYPVVDGVVIRNLYFTYLKVLKWHSNVHLLPVIIFA
jgi:hypothetical protein